MVGEERRVAGRHLVHEHPERPPVDGLVVPFAQDDLGREVLGRPAQRPRPPLHSFCEAEVGDLENAIDGEFASL